MTEIAQLSQRAKPSTPPANQTNLRASSTGNIVLELPADLGSTKQTIAGKAVPVGKFAFTIDTQGDTGTPSLISIKQMDLDGTRVSAAGNLLRVRVCEDGTYNPSTTASLAAGSGSSVVETMVGAAYAGTVAEGIMTDDDSASSNGTAVKVAINPDGVTAYLESTTANNADAVFAIGNGGPVINVNDNDSPASVVLYFDEDAASADSRFLVISPSGKDVFVPTSSGQFLRLKHDASAASNGVAVYFDDNGSNNYERFLYVSPTNADGEFTTDDDYSQAVAKQTGKDIVLSTVAASPATGTLTISGVVLNTEKVTINSRVYEFRTGQTALTGNVSVDISAGGTKSAGTLTVAAQPTSGDTMTIGNKVYTFRATADEDGEIAIGGSLGATQTNIRAAINGTDSINTAHTQVTAAAFATNASVITARYTGTWANSLATTETFTSGSNVFDAATLGTTTAGVGVTATQAGDALVTALASDTSAVVTGSNASGVVTLTSKVSHEDANSYGTTETMANGAFGAATLSGGITVRTNMWRISLTETTTDKTNRLVIGPPPVGPFLNGDYSAELDVTHEAP